MIHLNHATHAFFTPIYEQRVSQAAGIATLVSPSRNVLIAKDDTSSNYRTANKCMCAFLLS